ncbi:isoprenylcysteine carboxylmethyltransferase family protein [Patescibacteria group bacterium]|nr:isoprenylcysteine carboxylmethyltransferase family protein [Patescibacteria group bacterium]
MPYQKLNYMKKKHIIVEILPRLFWVIQGMCLALGQRIFGKPLVLSGNIIIVILGLLITVLGVILFAILLVWFFKYRAKAGFSKELVQTGPYKYIRHPMYVFIYLILIGVGMLWFSSNWFIILIVFIPVWYFMSRVEEKQMNEMTGGKYQEYMKRTGMFFPKIK